MPRQTIAWDPVDEAACIGRGTCVTGCSHLVYRFDYERRKSVVVDPLNCMVGCTTCANTCPTHAIHFPPLATVRALEGRPEVRHAIEDDLIARREQLARYDVVPHPERLKEGDTLRVRGPLGHFTLSSDPGTPLVFVASGTGFAPIKAMVESILAFDVQRDMVLFWGVGTRDDLYEADVLADWARRDARLTVFVAVDRGPLPEGLPPGVQIVASSVTAALGASGISFAGRDAYVAGPPAMMPFVVEALKQGGVTPERIRVDFFGL